MPADQYDPWLRFGEAVQAAFCGACPECLVPRCESCGACDCSDPELPTREECTCC